MKHDIGSPDALSSQDWTQIDHISSIHGRAHQSRTQMTPLFAPSSWSHQHEHRTSCTVDFRQQSPTSVSVDPFNRLSSQPNLQSSSELWKHIKDALHAVADATHDFSSFKHQKWWASSTSVAPLDARRPVPPDATYNVTLNSLGRQLTVSLWIDCKQRWVGNCWEVEKAAVIVINSNLYRLSANTGPRKSGVREVIKESSSSLIHPRGRHLER